MFRPILLLFAAISFSAQALTTADGPDYYAVNGVATSDAFSLHVSPSADAEKIGQIPHDARGLQNLGCQGLPAQSEWERMSKRQCEDSRKRYWCKVRYQGVEGWVAGRFLRKDGAPPMPAANPAPHAGDFTMACRETAAYQVGVSDEGKVTQEATAVRETQPLRINVKSKGGSDSIRMVTFHEESGQLKRQMEGTLESEPRSKPEKATGCWICIRTYCGVWRPSPAARRGSWFTPASGSDPGRRGLGTTTRCSWGRAAPTGRSRRAS